MVPIVPIWPCSNPQDNGCEPIPLPCGKVAGLGCLPPLPLEGPLRYENINPMLVENAKEICRDPRHALYVENERNRVSRAFS